MPIVAVLAGVHTDSEMADGQIRVDVENGYSTVFFMSPATYRGLLRASRLGEVCDELEVAGPGTYAVPLSAEVARQLQFAEPGDSDQCVLPSCLQDAAGREYGFPLCARHSADWADRDSLLA